MIKSTIQSPKACITCIQAALFMTKTSSKVKKARNCITVIIIKFTTNLFGLFCTPICTKNQESVNRIIKKIEFKALSDLEILGKKICVNREALRMDK